MEIAILGAGLAGLSAAFHLEQMGFDSYQIFEKNTRVGGLCRSETINGFTFDYAIHILYSSDEYATALIRNKLLVNNLRLQIRRSYVYYRGVYTEYPFQAHLHGREPEVIKECILGLVRSAYEKSRKPHNFEEWIHTTFGEGMAKHFMVPYNTKQWATDLKRMNYDWISSRVPIPSLEEVLDGALKPPIRKYGPNAYFWYPLRGGIGSLPEGFLPHVRNLRLNTEVKEIDPKKKKVVIGESKKEVRYDKLVLTLPICRLLDLVNDPPNEVGKAIQELQYNKVYAINLGINKKSISDKHWIYFPEKEFIFQRIDFPMNLSHYMVPRGKSSITAEVSVSKHRPLDVEGERLVERVIRDLARLGIIGEDEVVLRDLRVLDPAYVIYDLDHGKNVKIIHEYLKSNGIYPCGRFGEWEYLNMDHAILSGKRVVEEISRRD